ncbi:hypothetical protein H4R23_005077 [Coemansia sp. Cherry 401B]|nr:hypothetical protein H4R23_005077 [Coemansia sp. Cherry 401B]
MTAVGLGGAPAIKAWMCVLTVLSVLGASSAWARQHLLRLRFVPHLTHHLQFWRLATTPLAFSTTTELLVCLALLFQLRTVERLLGTRRFAALVFTGGLVGQAIALLLLAGARLVLTPAQFAPLNVWAGGPICSVFACVHAYFAFVPGQQRVRVAGVSVGDKWMTYAIAANLVVLRMPAAVVPAIAGVLAGAVVASDVGGLRQWRFPAWAARLVRPLAAANGRVRQAADDVPAGLVDRLQSMFPGVDREQAAQALRVAGGNADRATACLKPYTLLLRDGTRHVLPTVPIAPAAGQHADEFVVYADGSCLGNGTRRARAGIGVYFGEFDRRNVSEPLAGARQCSQRAELAALVCALRIVCTDMSFHRVARVRICTDSMFAINCVDKWHRVWARNGWRHANGAEVVDRDLVLEAVDVVSLLRTQLLLTHVQAHRGIEGNEQADRLAIEGAHLHPEHMNW